MQHIRSRDNQHIKHLAKLAQSKSYRHEHQACIVEGERALQPFVASRHRLIGVYMTHAMYKATSYAISPEYITIVPDHVMDKISPVQTPSGIVGHIHVSTWTADAPQPGLCLVNVSDPGNVGTLIRTSIALNYTTISLITCADPWNPKAVQASAGTIAHAYCHITTWQDIQYTSHVTPCALTAHNAEPIEDVAIDNPLIVIGNEAHGVPHEIIASSDYRVRLHMPGQAESYNASVAGSIALYMLTHRKGT